MRDTERALLASASKLPDQAYVIHRSAPYGRLPIGSGWRSGEDLSQSSRKLGRSWSHSLTGIREPLQAPFLVDCECQVIVSTLFGRKNPTDHSLCCCRYLRIFAADTES